PATSRAIGRRCGPRALAGSELRWWSHHRCSLNLTVRSTERIPCVHRSRATTIWRRENPGSLLQRRGATCQCSSRTAEPPPSTPSPPRSRRPGRRRTRPTSGRPTPDARTGRGNPGTDQRARPPALELQRLGLQELLEAVTAEFTSVTGLLVATERCERVERTTVDLQGTGANPPRDRLGLLAIGTPDTA